MTVEPIGVGEQAPDFTLRDQNGVSVSLADFRGSKHLLVVFYPWAFSSICTGELTYVRDNLGDFVTDDLDVVAISCDSMFAQRAYADRDAYFFPLLADSWPHGAVASAFGVFDEAVGAAIRGTFLIDPDGIVRWSLVTGIGEARDFRGFAGPLAESRARYAASS